MFRKLHEYRILFSIENWNRCMLNYLHPRRFFLKIHYFSTLLRGAYGWFPSIHSQTKLITVVWPRPGQLLLYQTLFGQGKVGWLNSHTFIGYMYLKFFSDILDPPPFPRGRLLAEALSVLALCLLFFLNTLFSQQVRPSPLSVSIINQAYQSIVYCSHTNNVPCQPWNLYISIKWMFFLFINSKGNRRQTRQPGPT